MYRDIARVQRRMSNEEERSLIWKCTELKRLGLLYVLVFLPIYQLNRCWVRDRLDYHSQRL